MTRKILTTGLVLALAACGGSSSGPDPFASATPDVSGLALEISGNAAEGAAALAAPATGQYAIAPADTTCQPWQYLCQIRKGVRGLNAWVKAAVGPIEALSQTPPSATDGNVSVYGPADLPAAQPVASFKLTVKKDGDPDHFKFKLEAAPLASTDPSKYVVVMAGKIQKGQLAHRGRGVLGIDLDKLAAVNPVAFKGAGKLLGSFTHLGQAKSLVYVLDRFTPDATTTAPIDAAFVGFRAASGETRVRLAAKDDFIAPQGGVEPTPATVELLLSRARWVPGLGGRAAVVVTDTAAGGDVASYQADFLLGLSCFDAAEQEGVHKLFACTTSPKACVDVTPAAWPAPPADPTLLCRPNTDLFDAQNPPPVLGAKDPAPEPGAPGTNDPVPADVSGLGF